MTWDIFATMFGESSSMEGGRLRRLPVSAISLLLRRISIGFRLGGDVVFRFVGSLVGVLQQTEQTPELGLFTNVQCSHSQANLGTIGGTRGGLGS